MAGRHFIKGQVCALIALLSPAAGYAQTQATDDKASLLPEVVTSASRSEERVLDTAASINILNSQNIHDGQAEQNLSEPLARVPGIFALNRQNYAQDMLISSRGFGANSTFGARNIKLFVDGIPGTMADGQGQMSHIDLVSTDRIEVMRGPFSALYGNSAGGVISVFTESGKPGAEATPYFSAGSFGQRKYGLKLGGEQNDVNFMLDAGILKTNGYRDHSNADRQNDNAKIGFKLGADTTLTLVANNLSLRAQDPLGLTAAQLQSNARGAGNNALSFDTRKSVDQTQGGLTLTHRLGAQDTLTVVPYYGERHTIQYLATGSNGVIDLNRTFFGLNTQWLHIGDLGGVPYKVVTGLEGNENEDSRLAFANTLGNRTGPATQNYNMVARARDGFMQAEFRPSERVAFNGGLRHSQVLLSSVSNLATTPSPGSHTYQATTSMASIQYYLQEKTNAYLSYGSGFDTPTLNQVFYSPASLLTVPATNTGNIGLQAARTRQLELGLKSELSATTRMNVAVFDTGTTNDIVVAISNGGRSAFTNAPKTERRGLELSAQTLLTNNWQASLAYTRLSAKVLETYSQINVSGSTSAVLSGNRIPGVPNQGLFAELLWRQSDNAFEFAVEGRAAGSIAANDLNVESAGGYAIANVRALARQTVGGWKVSEFVRVDNIFDRAYVGSVIVNQASRQFYESAPGRNWLAGINATFRF